MKATTLRLGLIMVLEAIRAGAQTTSPIVPPPLTDSFTPAAVAPGTPAGSYILSGFDTVNYGTLSVNFRFPLVKIGGRGSVSTVLMPDFAAESQWQVHPTIANASACLSGQYATQTCTWNYNISNVSWSIPTSIYGVPRMMVRNAEYACTQTNVGTVPTWATYSLNRLTFIGSDGTEIAFLDQQTGGLPHQYASASQAQAGFNRGTHWVSRDGTSAFFTATGDIVDSATSQSCGASPTGVSGTLTMRDGTKYVFQNGLASSITDRNGNTITIGAETSTGTVTFVDSDNRQYTVAFNPNGSSGRYYDLLQYPGMAGVTRSIKIFHDSLSNQLRTTQTYDKGIENDNQLWPGVLTTSQTPSTHNQPYISEIDLPDGSSYSFQRDSYGNVARIVLPTGGAVEYDWVGQVGTGTVGNGPNTPQAFLLRCQLTQRREYLSSAAGTPPWRITNFSGGTASDTDGSGNVQAKTVHTVVAPALSLRRTIDYDDPTVGQEPHTYYYDADGKTLLRQIDRTYQERSCGGDATCWWLTNSNSDLDSRPPHDYLPYQETTTEGSAVKQTVTLYDGYNNPNKVTESDWGTSNAPGNVLRQVLTTYNTGPSYTNANILNLPTDVQVQNGSNTIVSESSYGYDEVGLGASYAPVQNTAPTTPRGNRTSITECVGSSSCAVFKTYYTYDSAGNVLTVKDGNNNRTTLVYNDNYTVSQPVSTYAHVTSITNALGQTSSWQYDFGTGRPTQVTDPNQVQSLYQSQNDPLDRLTNISNASNVTAATSDVLAVYTGTTQVDLYSDQNSAADQALHSRTLYDGLGRESTKQVYESAASAITTTKAYDALGRVYSTTNPSRGGDGLGFATNYGYDGLGRPTSVKTVDGAVTTTCYSSNPNCSTPSGVTTGNWQLVTDQAGKQRQTFTDGLGRLSKVIEGPAAAKYMTTYSYDALDDLVGVSQSGMTRSFAYDSLKRLLAAFNPENSSSTNAASQTCTGTSGSAWSTCYTYDNLGNLLTRTDNRGVQTSYTYDQLNRVLSKSYSVPSGVAATPNATYCYDNSSSSGCVAQGGVNYPVGHLTSVMNGNGQAPFATGGSQTLFSNFDGLGRVLSNSQISNGNTYSFQYAYNRAGSLTCESYPSGKAVGTAYDAANRVAQVAVGCVSGGNPPIGMPAYVTGTTSMAAAGGMGIQYAPHGAPTSFYYGNKVVRSMSYNNRLQMAGFDDSITMQGTSSVKYDLLNASLNWYIGSATATNNGNLWGSTYTISGPGYSAPLPFTQVYMYDGENRLSNVTDQTNGTSNFTRGFLYDAFGNMWVDTTTAATTTGITPSGNTPTANVYAATGRNQINGGSYDAAGNEILVNGNNVTYDGEGRQTAVAGSGVNETYIYDADGKRVGKVGSGTNPPTTVFVYDALGRMAAQYATVPDATNCITCYLSADQLGTARLVTDQGGNVVARHDYLPFGEEITAPQLAGRDSHWGVSGDLIQQKFTGKERDSESGLDYFGARYYGSALGRFTSPDDAADTTLSVPIPYAELEDPQSLNLYAYVRNNPLRYTDPDGHDYRVCVNGSAGQQCVTLNDDQYQQLFNQQNGKQGISLPGGPAGGNITCGGANCGSVSYTENSLYDPLPGIVVGAMAGQGAGLALRGVGGLVAGLSARTAGAAIGEGASQTAAKVLLSGGGKQAAKEVIEGLAEGAQKASAKRAVAAATKSESISISQSADGTLSITRTRPGFDGSQTFTKTISSGGASSTVQTAHDAAGNLVHYDPKN